MDKWILKEYDFWILEGHGSQPTLGSALLRFKRRGVDKLSALLREEMLELKEAAREYEDALQKTFYPDAVDYFELSDRGSQLSVHAIPRYQKERNFAGKLWQDKGQWPAMQPSGDIKEICQTLQAHLPVSEQGCLFYFVRHGETEWNKQSKVLGHENISINQDGRAQAQELKSMLAPLSFDKVVCSDLKRAYDTASIAVEGRGQAIMQDSRLRSRDWGDLTGRATTLLYMTNPELFACVETNEAIEARVFDFLEEFVAKYPEAKKALVVCHGSIIRITMSKLLGFVFEGIIHVPNTAWLKISHRKRMWKLEEVKDIQLPINLRFTR